MVEKQHLIDLQHISKDFDGTRVLDDINLYIRKREFVTLLGPSGCGKTTTLRIIGGFEYPTERQSALRGQGHWQPAALQAQGEHHFPEIRAVPPPQRV